MDPHLFLKDLERKSELLNQLADSLAQINPWSGLGINPQSHVIFLGMGSSHYASSIAAMRLRALGMNAVAELASNNLLPKITDSTVIIAVSASGNSIETLTAVNRLKGKARIIAVTNYPDSEIAEASDATVVMRAEVEIGGVACRSFAHTVALHLALESHLFQKNYILADIVRSAAVAHEYIWSNRSSWQPKVQEILTGASASYFVAPAERFSSAQQSALMFREGPRRASVGCETGDWSHVDVYLTKVQDYRLLIFAGSNWEKPLMTWCTERKSRVVAVGGEIEGAEYTFRYPGDESPEVALIVESFFSELIAADLWINQQ
ncbi:MAG: SIS domain-containing protein [Actinomycetes bacterium]